MTLETTIAKPTAEWKVVGDVSIVDMRNGYNLIKFTNPMACVRIFERQPWFISGQYIVYMMETQF